MASPGLRYLTDMLGQPPAVRRFKDRYAVEASGVVWEIACPGGRIAPSKTAAGKLVIAGTNIALARVVAELWVPNPNGKKHIVHLDGNTNNVAATNLAWK